MINIWKDKENAENSGQVFDTKSKLDLGGKSHKSIKKQAFGELKNVIHNQPNITPFKKLGSVANVSKTKCATPLVPIGHKREHSLKPRKDVIFQTPTLRKTPIGRQNGNDIFDCFDFQTNCLKKSRNDNQNFWPESDNKKLEKIFEDFHFTNGEDNDDDKPFCGVDDGKDIDIDELFSLEKINIASFVDDSMHFSQKVPELEDFLFD